MSTNVRSSCRPSFAAAWAVISCASVVGGCAPPQKPIPIAPASRQVSVSPDERFFAPPLSFVDPEDAVVRIVGPTATCTGALVDSDLVLTAHHCVAERGAHGEFMESVVSARTLSIEFGTREHVWGKIAAKYIVVPSCGEAGGEGDIAVLVLEKKISKMKTLSMRLDIPPKKGEVVDAVGFGKCSLSGPGIRRMHREGGAIEWAKAGAIRLDAAVCPGDSGGPVVLRTTGEIVGVVSLSAMDGDEKTRSPSVMARVDTFRPIFAYARLIADGHSPGELPPLTCDR